MRELPWICTKCNSSFTSEPKRSFWGFLKFYCSKCEKEFSFPLTKGYRIGYFVALVIISVGLVNGFFVLEQFRQAEMEKTGQFIQPFTIKFYLSKMWFGLLLLVASIYALAKDVFLRRRTIAIHISPALPISEEQTITYYKTRNILLIGLVGVIIGYGIIAFDFYLLSAKLINTISHWRILFFLGLFFLLLSNVVSMVAAYKACSLLNEPYKRYAIGIPFISLFLFLSGPFFTIALLLPIQKNYKTNNKS